MTQTTGVTAATSLNDADEAIVNQAGVTKRAPLYLRVFQSFGGVTSAFPALKRVGAVLAVRFADDSGDANISCGSVIASGVSKTVAHTVAGLPSASANGAGSYSFVSDATATTFNSIVAGGGSNAVPVFSDGTNWRIG